jgi:hypothetical protein
MNDTDIDPIVVKADNYFAQIPYWILELGLSSEAVHLYAVLIRFSNWVSHQGYPSRKRLSECMKVSIKAVDRAKDELVQAKVLKYDRRHNKSNYYTVITTNPSSVDFDPSDKNDISRGDKNDTLTKVINNNNKTATPNGVQQLVTSYFDNFRGEVKPSGGQVAGHIQILLKQIPAERLLELIPLVAMDGKPLTVNTVGYYANRQPEKKSEPTRTPPPYRASEAPVGVPIPEDVKKLRDNLKNLGKMPE